MTLFTKCIKEWTMSLLACESLRYCVDMALYQRCAIGFPNSKL